MVTKTYARVADGTVFELLHTGDDIAKLFHPSLHWVDVTGETVASGWQQTATGFAPPPPAPPPAPPSAPVAAPEPAPTLAELQGELAILAKRLAAFAEARDAAPSPPAAAATSAKP